MQVIYKYRVPFKETATVVLPQHANIIRVDGLDGAIWLWAIVDTDNPLVEREFRLFKTGGVLPDDINTHYTYVGCGAIFVQMELMMYLFEKGDNIPQLHTPPTDFEWKEVQEA